VCSGSCDDFVVSSSIDDPAATAVDYRGNVLILGYFSTAVGVITGEPYAASSAKASARQLSMSSITSMSSFSSEYSSGYFVPVWIMIGLVVASVVIASAYQFLLKKDNLEMKHGDLAAGAPSIIAQPLTGRDGDKKDCL
jgi:hypothetical protein